MTASNNGKTIALVIIIVILALFAFRSAFFLLPFGVLPGVSRMAGEMGHSVNGWFHGFDGIGRFFMFVLPAALIVLWGAVLIWVYQDAEKRGMSGILWLLLVLIGNIIGLLVYAIVRSETGLGRRNGSAGGTAAPPAGPAGPCPHCGKPVATEHAFCPYCGKSLKTTCPACGKPVDPEWKVCPACGTNLDPGAPRQA